LRRSRSFSGLASSTFTDPILVSLARMLRYKCRATGKALMSRLLSFPDWSRVGRLAVLTACWLGCGLYALGALWRMSYRAGNSWTSQDIWALLSVCGELVHGAKHQDVAPGLGGWLQCLTVLIGGHLGLQGPGLLIPGLLVPTGSCQFEMIVSI
jgi:hypothetical protein